MASEHQPDPLCVTSSPVTNNMEKAKASQLEASDNNELPEDISCKQKADSPQQADQYLEHSHPSLKPMQDHGHPVIQKNTITCTDKEGATKHELQSLPPATLFSQELNRHSVFQQGRNQRETQMDEVQNTRGVPMSNLKSLLK